MNTLQVAADSPWWLHAGAALILYLHIVGGTVAILSGGVALLFRKGSRAHRAAGNVFFVSMLVMLAVGAAVSPFLTSPEGDGKWFDAIAAVLTLYLVATAWATVRRQAGTVGRFESGAFVFATAAAIGMVLLCLQVADRPTGTLGGYAASDYAVFAALFALAAALDLNTILRGGASGVRRIARHIWRMCTALFVAVGAFFLGQQRVMPEFIQGSPLLTIPPLAVLALMLFWLIKVRTARLFNRLRSRLRLRRREPAGARLG